MDFPTSTFFISLPKFSISKSSTLSSQVSRNRFHHPNSNDPSLRNKARHHIQMALSFFQRKPQGRTQRPSLPLRFERCDTKVCCRDSSGKLFRRGFQLGRRALATGFTRPGICIVRCRIGEWAQKSVYHFGKALFVLRFNLLLENFPTYHPITCKMIMSQHLYVHQDD